MGNFYTLLTNTGINAIIAARASKSEVKLTKIAVGDGDIIPSQDMTALKSEKHRFNINSIIQDIDNPNYLIIEGVIPSNIGGFYVSEIAIYTDQNTLFAIGSLPKTYKPLLEEGSAKDLTIKIFLEITNADSVTLKVDDTVVLATRKFVLSELKKYALINGNETKRFKVADAVELNEAINKKQFDNTAVKLTGNQTIAGVKTFSSNIVGNITGNSGTATKLATARTINGVSFDGSTNITVVDNTAVKLTENQTIAGVKIFSENPQSTATQSLSIAALTRKDYVDGLDSVNVKLNGNQTIAGVKTFSSSPIVPTPTTGTQAVNKTYADLKVALTDFTGANQSFATNGYQKLPGGLIVQWGSATSNASGEVTLTLPITFPLQAIKIYAISTFTSRVANIVNAGGGTSSEVKAYVSNTAGAAVSGAQVSFLIIGN